MPKYGVNKQIIVGNLGADAELLYVGDNNIPKCSFSAAATVRTGTDQAGNPRTHTEWFQCVLWGKRAEALAPYLTKGKCVYVEGRTETRSWEDEAGERHYRTEVRVDELTFLGGGQRQAQGGSNGEGPPPSPPEPVDEIPF